MRLAVVFFLGWLLAAGAAEAAPKTPHFKRGAPYSVVRAELLRHDLEPVRVMALHKLCPAACKPELLHCAGDRPLCLWLFVRRADGALFEVMTRYEGWPEDDERGLTIQRFETIERVTRSSLSYATLVMPDGRVIPGTDPISEK